MSPGQNPTISETTAAVSLSTDFRADDADIVIRVEGSLDFRVHKFILSLASPFFKEMFTIPQPPPTASDVLPHVDVHETARTWENIFRTIYSTQPDPTIDTLDDLESLLSAARKYEMQCIFDSHKNSFERRAFMEQDPLRLYAIACGCGLDDQAKYVARNADLPTVFVRDEPDNLNGLTLTSYRRLIAYLFKRDNELYPILERHWASFNSYCDCMKAQANLYARTKRELEKPYVQMEEVYLVALKDRSRYYKKACIDEGCVLVDEEIRRFLKRVFKAREEVRNKFMWK